MKKNPVLSVLVLQLVLMIACNGGDVPTDIPPTESPPTPGIPDAPLSSNGPWVFFASDDGAWALNPDGSGLTSIWNIYGEGRNIDFLRWWAAPRGGRVALLEIDDTFDLSIPVLKIITLPGGTIETIATLMPEDFDYSALDRDGQARVEQVWAAVGVWNNMAWSSDGSMLAFNAAIDGPSADLYVYSTRDGSITRLTDGPSQSANPIWSPDDAFILHSAAEQLNYGYSGAGYDMLNVWAARPDDSGVEKVFDHEFYGFERVLGWLDDTRYLGDSEELWCGYFDLREIDIFDGVVRSLHTGHYGFRAYAPGHAATLLAIHTEQRTTFDCSLEFDPGVYLLDNQSGQATAVPDIPHDEVSNIVWSDEAGAFFVVTWDALYTVDPSGAVMTHQFPLDVYDGDPPTIYDDDPVVNSSGSMWVLRVSPTRTLALGTRGGDIVKLDVDGARSPIWSPDGRHLLFFGNHDRGPSIYLASSPDFEPFRAHTGFLFGGYGPVLIFK
jgi:hypothetical protein